MVIWIGKYVVNVTIADDKTREDEMKKLPYTKHAYYTTKPAALKEAARMRKTGGYNAKVLANISMDKHFRWVLWTQRKER